MVEGGRLTPAHVPPVSGAGVHRAEETRTAAARADEGRTGVRVGKSDTAVSRAKHDVSPVGPAAGTTAITAVFVHAGDVHVARNLVGGDLNVSDEDGPSGNREVHGRTPSDTVISRAHDRDGRPSTSEVVEGDIHSPEERRGWVIIRIARIAVVESRCCERRNGSSYSGPMEWSTCNRRGPDRRRPSSSQTVNQVPVGLLYRITGSPKVPAKGL